jgi:tetrahydromethanopterin S-methyltransferase subunit G
MWNVDSNGQLRMIYMSSIREAFEDAEAWPDQKIWDYWVDAMDAEDMKARRAKLERRLKEFKFSLEDLGVAFEDVDMNNIYVIDWPSNISRLIFLNLLEAVKAWGKDEEPIYYLGMLKPLRELAKAIDSIQQDLGLTQSKVVEREYKRVGKLVKVDYGEEVSVD